MIPVTILVVTSPVPSHPSTEIIEDTISRVLSYPVFADAPLMVLADGVHESQRDRAQDYAEYLKRLQERLAVCKAANGHTMMMFPEHAHQSGMMMAALDRVATPFLFFVEHDTFPTGDIDFQGILRVLTAWHADVVRLHINHRILTEHEYLFDDLAPRIVEGVPICRTRMWSQRPHIARADWYRRVMTTEFDPGDRCMIEDRLWGIVANAPWSEFRVAIYAPDGNMTRSGHSNARAGDPKHIGTWKA